MPTLSTTVDPRSPSYVDSRQAMLVRLDELHEALAAARTGGYSAVARAIARERVELLLDRDAPFLELCPLAGWGTDGVPGAGIVGGIGDVEGVRCMIIASDPAVPGSLPALKKVRRLGEIAAANRLPRIHLLDGPEADPAQDGTAHHQVLRDLARTGAGEVPGIAVVLGRGTGATAHLSGYSVAVQRLAGDAPVDFPAEDERDAVRLTRLCVRRLNAPRPDPVPAAPPKYDPDELLGLTPAQPREILARLLDGSEFDEFQARYGAGLVTGWGALHGYPVGVVAGQSSGTEDAVKAARFIARANAPLLFLDSGETGDPALIEAVATSAVPHLTVDVGGGTGLCGRAYRPRFLFSWPRSGALDRSGRLHDDGVLDPRDTRTALGIALAVAHREAP